MADKTLYEILEVSPSASAETIRAAYDRLSAKLDPDHEANKGNPEARILHEAVKEAFLTLANPARRAQYDRKIAAHTVLKNVEVVEPFWTTPRMAVAVIIACLAGWIYYGHKQEEMRLARLQAERAVAAAKAKEAEEQARLEAEQARLEYQRQAAQRAAEDRQRREHEVALQRMQSEQRVRDRQEQYDGARQRREQEMRERREADFRRRQEQQAAAAAQQQAARERAELCRIERERYGRAISC